MAEPISTASGILTIAGFVLASSNALYKTVESFRTTKRTIRELKDELDALVTTLGSLQLLAQEDDSDFKPLKLPLIRCGEACKDFNEIINKCTANSNGPRTSFRDWARLQYMGENITQFKIMISGYKSTISIAIGGATLRKVTATASTLDEYKTLIANTKSDLEEFLQDMDRRLEAPPTQNEAPLPSERSAELSKIQEQKDSALQCLQICTRVDEFLNEVQNRDIDRVSFSSDARQSVAGTLRGFSDRMVNLRANIEQQCVDLDKESKRILGEEAPDDGDQKLQQIHAQRESLKKCLEICDEATQQVDPMRMNMFEDVTSSDDAHQVIVSTIGDLVSAKRIVTGCRSAQWMGQVSDESLQQLSRDRAQTFSRSMAEPGSLDTFHSRYGAGHALRDDIRSQSPV